MRAGLTTALGGRGVCRLPIRDDPLTTPLYLTPAFQDQHTPPQLGGAWELVRPDTSPQQRPEPSPAAPPTHQDWEILRKDELSLSVSSIGGSVTASLAQQQQATSPRAVTQGVKLPGGFDLEALLARDLGVGPASVRTPTSIRLDEDQRRLLEELYAQVGSDQPKKEAAYGG